MENNEFDGNIFKNETHYWLKFLVKDRDKALRLWLDAGILDRPEAGESFFLKNYGVNALEITWVDWKEELRKSRDFMLNNIKEPR